jgi:hypothetical protein
LVSSASNGHPLIFIAMEIKKRRIESDATYSIQAVFIRISRGKIAMHEGLPE